MEVRCGSTIDELVPFIQYAAEPTYAMVLVILILLKE